MKVSGVRQLRRAKSQTLEEYSKVEVELKLN